SQRATHKRDRFLRTRGSVLPTAYWSSAFCRRNNLRNRSAGLGNRTSATAAIEPEDRSRTFHDLSKVFGERSKAPLLVRSRAGRRFGTLAKARTNPAQSEADFSHMPANGCG